MCDISVTTSILSDSRVLCRKLFVQPHNRARLFRWFAAVALLIVATLLFFAALSSRRDRVTLPSGLTVQWLGVTEGTTALIDGNIIQKLLGDRIPAKGLNLGFTTLTRPRKFQPHKNTDHIAWFRLIGTNPYPRYRSMGPGWEDFEVVFQNSAGRELNAPNPWPYTSSSSNALFAIPMDAYPRDKSKVTMRIGTPLGRNPNLKTEQQWAEFDFKTPNRVTKLPSWTLQFIPATNYVDGFPIVLRSASASESIMDLTLPSADWTVAEMTIFDQEGNRYSMSQFFKSTPPDPNCSISFHGSFGAARPWHARLKIVHARGFRKQRSHPIPEPDFPQNLLRRVALIAGDPPVLITNNTGESFSCQLENGQITIRGNTPDRPFWVLISALGDSEVIGHGGTGWKNPNSKNPFGEQHFPLFRNVTNLTLELACPQVLSTEFYFQPAE